VTEIALPASGGCACGAIRYELREEPLTLYACHCGDCQTQSGSAFSLSAFVKRAAIVITRGETRSWRRRAESGRMMTCHFCPDCGTRLWNDPDRLPDMTVLKPGTLDDTRWLRPIGHVWTKSALPGTAFAPGEILYDEQPPDLSKLIEAWQRRTR
jgi:hypothetical protein